MIEKLVPLLRTPASVVWLGLMTATFVSWWLGAGHGLEHRDASVVILLVAFAKARFVGLYFMELRDAPRVLRGLFEGYCVLVFAVVLGMYLAG
jgi:caa(3)-type oxidase subunit IV